MVVVNQASFVEHVLQRKNVNYSKPSFPVSISRSGSSWIVYEDAVFGILGKKLDGSGGEE